MSNLFVKSFHFVFTKLKLSPAATAPSPDCYFTSNPISVSPSSSTTAAADDSFSDELAAVYASGRLLLSSPGRSNSILESSDARRRYQQRNDAVWEVAKYSRDPYGDFRRSMQEMVEAGELEINVRSDWEFLRQLLSSYLRLNPKNTHKFILAAFADLVLCLLASSPPPPRKFVIFR